VSDTVNEFTVAIGDDEIADLEDRLARTRWPDRIPGVGWDYGVDADWVRDLADYWANGFNWRTAENRLNAFDHLTTEIDGQRIHAIHQRSPSPDALPLVISHGWPGSVVEFLDIIGPLTDPKAHGGDPADAFHVVAPSLPGYAWSGPTTDRGWGPTRIARAFATLAARLGYDRYGVQGGDWGSIISQEIARTDSEHVAGCHVNMITTRPPGQPDDMEDLSPFEQTVFDRAAWYQAEDNGYFRIQQTRPQTLGTGLNDSPAGLLAWIGEKFHGWTDHDGDPFTAVDRDTILANVSVYWFTGTANSSTRIYFELMRTLEAGFGTTGDVPLGVSVFPRELFAARRRWVEAAHNLVFWAENDRGGHFAALETPDLLVDDIRACFRDLR
jgi:pimeloyl-ACP methyl ester carboxylesterase